jgi:UDP-2,4-diacetamido-2,4,6-trideoxy-beta-L-altropyranose hydrolase
MKPGNLLMRADATVASGTGHVMRCVALAQAWQRAGGEVIFAMAQCDTAIQRRLLSEQVKLVAIEAKPGSVEDMEQTIDAAVQQNVQWAVVDGYSFDSKYLSGLQSVRPVLMIDDNGVLGFYAADLVLNQNPFARADMYVNRGQRTRLLLGPRYVLLRNEFAAYRIWRRPISDVGRRILVTMGGSDPKNLTPRILAALSEMMIDDLQIRVVVGGSAENWRGIAEVAAGFPGRVEVLSDVANMAELMAWADLAIAGAGTTCWEICLLGLPAALVVVAENQRSVAEELARLGAAVNAGLAEVLDCSSLARMAAELLGNGERRANMSRAARELVDGLGTERVRAELLDRQIRLRLICESDCRLLFEWARDPEARAASFRSADISWDEHSHWFVERMQDPDSVIYIGENSAGEPVGLVRFQIRGDSAVLSVNVSPGVRGRGWGRELITFSTNSLVRSRSVRRVDAYVKPGNEASVRLFEASGFRRAAADRVADQQALLFTWDAGNGTHVN